MLKNSFFDAHFFIPLPDRRDDTSESSASWEMSFDDDIDFDGQIFNFCAPLEVSASARWVDNGVLSVNLSVRTKICGQCARCLERAELAISDNLLYLYSLRTSCDNERDEWVVEVKFFGKTLDIAEQVREGLLLLLPLKLLCSENCRGLCSSCGAKLDFVRGE